MPYIDVFAGTATSIGTVAAVIGVWNGFSPARRQRRAKRQQWIEDLDGRPPRTEGGVIVEEGRPSLAASVHTLTEVVARIDERTEQLTRNGGTSMADAVHRMEQALADKHAENQAQIAALGKQAVEASALAGKAATLAAVSQEEGKAQRQELFDEVHALKTEVWTRFEETDLRDRVYLAALAELGIDLRDEEKD